MPIKKKKKFIDKKNALTFHLVHRSQQDPLQASEEAPKHVLLPKEKEVKLEEQQKYGIFYDDEYDYMQHLKDVNEVYALEQVDRVRIEAPQTKKKPKVNLPSSVFASELETEIGLLNRAAPVSGPKIDWDPDVVAALDDDFNFDDPENTLDDDFIVKANATDDVGMEYEDDEEEEIASDEADVSDAGSDIDLEDFGQEHAFMEEETKSRFTQYSMTSSVIRRNKGLTLLDDRFEKFYEQFDDSEIGALDHEDIDGTMDQNNQVLSTVLEEFEKKQGLTKLKEVDKGKEKETYEEDPSEEEEMIKIQMEESKEKWDCESILSTYSNLYNHPKLIEEPSKKKISLTSRIGIPNDVFDKKAVTKRQLEKQIHENMKADTASTYRPKDESLDEKKARKQAVKAERKERRQQKKANKMAFSTEKMRQEKEVLNLKNNLKGVHIV